MDGFIGNLLKYLLFFVNFILFIFGCVILGLSVLVLVDGPQFLELVEETKAVVSEEADVDTSDLEVSIYTTAVYIFLALSAFLVLVSFCGCCGAWKENRCMLGIYFTMVLLLFVALIAGALLAYRGDLKKQIVPPLHKSISLYKDVDESQETSSEGHELALKKAWDTVQSELKCCGVENATDWRNASLAAWSPSTANKPKGCCYWKKGDEGEAIDISQDAAAVLTCRQNVPSLTELSKLYFFDGCFAKFEAEVKDNRQVVVWGTAIAALVLVATLLIALAMCLLA